MSLFGRLRSARSARLRTSARPAMAALAFALAFFWATAGAPAAMASQASGGPVVLIGVTGLRWDDISSERTPNLARFAREAASANLVVRTVGDATCPAQGWLTVGAGQRAKDHAVNCSPLQAPVPAASQPEPGSQAAASPSGPAFAAGDSSAEAAFVVPEWEAIEAVNASNSYAPKLGTLAAGVSPESTLAIGPGAALALADVDGEVAGTYVDVPGAGDLGAGVASAADAAEAFADFDGAQASLVVVDLGQIRHSGLPLGQDRPRPSDALEAFEASFRAADTSLPKSAEAQVKRVDADFGALLEQIEAKSPNAAVLVASLADAQNTSAQLQFFAARGLGDDAAPPTYAESRSTRQTGLVQLTDLTPTLLSLLGTPEAKAAMGSTSLPGSEVLAGVPVPDRSASAADYSSKAPPAEDVPPVSRLVDDHCRSQNSRSMVGIVYLVMGLTALASLAVAFRAWREGTPERNSQARQLTAFAAALPASSLLANLLPWWRTGSPRASLVAAIGVIAALVALVATARTGSRKPGWPLLVIGTVSFLTPTLDVLLDRVFSGYPLQLASVLGSQPQVGGRFYGLSNAPFAVCGVGLMMLLAFLAVRLDARGEAKASLVGASQSELPENATTVSSRRTLLIVIAIACFATAVDGLSFFGADFGGPPALAVGVGALALAASGRKLTVLRAGAIAAIAVGIALAFSLLDYLRPASERSHLGRFIGTVREGGLWRVISRKMSAVFLNLPVPAVIAIVALLVLVALGLTVAWRRGAIAFPNPARHSAHSHLHLGRHGDDAAHAEDSEHAEILAGGTAEASRTAEDSPAAEATFSGHASHLAYSKDLGHPSQNVAEESARMLRLAGIGTLAMLVTAFFLNDSGIVIPFIGLVVSTPTMLAEQLNHAQTRHDQTSSER